jgi:hypothetical protein
LSASLDEQNIDIIQTTGEHSNDLSDSKQVTLSKGSKT